MIKFLCDRMLIKLGKWLRAAGYDTLFIAEHVDDVQMLNIAVKENRILLTCDSFFSEMNKNVIFLSANELEKNVKELNKKLKINWVLHPFSRCLKCNYILNKINKDEILEEIPPHVKEDLNNFKVCKKCKKIYWEGSHAKSMLKTLKRWNTI